MLLEEGLLTDSDLTGPGRFSVWGTFCSRRQSKHLVTQLPFRLPATPLRDSRHLFHHFFIFFPYHLAELWPFLSPRPIQAAVHSLSPLVSAPGPDGNFPVALCGLRPCNLPPRACRLSRHQRLSERILVPCGGSGRLSQKGLGEAASVAQHGPGS